MYILPQFLKRLYLQKWAVGLQATVFQPLTSTFLWSTERAHPFSALYIFASVAAVAAACSLFHSLMKLCAPNVALCAKEEEKPFAFFGAYSSFQKQSILTPTALAYLDLEMLTMTMHTKMTTGTPKHLGIDLSWFPPFLVGSTKPPLLFPQCLNGQQHGLGQQCQAMAVDKAFLLVQVYWLLHMLTLFLS